MGEHWTHGRIRCCGSDPHSISMIWCYYQHYFQGGQLLLGNNWQHPTMHMLEIHQNVIRGFGKEREMVVLHKPLLCLQTSMQGGLQQ